MITFLIASLISLLFHTSAPVTPPQNIGGGSGTITTLDQWTSTTSPSSAITQRTFGKTLKITGLTTGLCLTLDGSSRLTTTACGGGGSLSGGTANMLASWVNSTTLTATGTPQVTAINATSSTATSTFNGNVNILGNIFQNGSPIGTSTALVEVDGRYNGFFGTDGSIFRPYRTLTAAAAGITASAFTSAAIDIVPGSTYTEQSLTLPNIPLLIRGNGASIVMLSGPSLGAGTLTIPSDIDIHDLTVFGNVLLSSTSLTNPHTLHAATIVGNLTLKGLAGIDSNSSMFDQNTALYPFLSQSASSTLTVGSGALVIVSEADIETVVNNHGTLNLDIVNLQTSTSTRYAVMSTTTGSVLRVNGMSLQNFGTGGGINCSNGATSASPNQISNTQITLGAGSTGAIDCGSATTFVSHYTAFTLAGTRLFSSGTDNLYPSFEGLLVNVGGRIGIASTTPGVPLAVTGAIVGTDWLTVPQLNATNTLATSTFAGGVTVGGGVSLTNFAGTGTLCVKSINGSLALSSADCGSGSGFSTTSADFYNSVNRDWKINTNGLLAPTSTKSIAVNGSATSTFGAGLEAPGIGSPWYSATSTTATSTFAGGLSVLNFNQNGAATSTFATGINIVTGCFSINNVCLSTSGTNFSTTSVDYYLSQFRDWKINGNGLLAPTTSRSIAVSGTATSTFSPGIEAPGVGSPWFSATSTTATSTFQGGFSALNLSQTGTATSTLNWGVNISNGCYALNNVCLTLSNISGTLAVSKGGTGATTLTGVLQGNGTGAVTAVTDSSTVGQVLRVTGASAYGWGALNLASTNAVTGTLPVSNGGTGSTNFSNSALVASNASGVLISTSTIAFQSFYATSTATSTSLGGLDVQQLNVGSTTATSTFQGGIWNVGGGLKLGTIKSCSSPNALQTDSNGGVICAAISATVTGPNSSIATFNGSGTLVGSSTPAATSFYATSSTATSTFIGNVNIGAVANAGQLPLQTPLMISGSVNNFLQTLCINTSNGNNASCDAIFGSDKDQTGNTYYLDVGKNNSGFAQASQASENALDGFVIDSDNSLVLGTASSTASIADIRFVTAGMSSSSIRMLIDKSGNIGMSTTTPGSILAVQGVANFRSGTSTIYSGITFPVLSATNTAASSTFAGGIVNTGGGLQLQTVKTCASPNALQTDSNGTVICAAISATVTGPASSMAAFNGSGTLIGSTTIAISSLFATTTTATSTFLQPIRISTTSPTAFLVTDGNFPNNPNPVFSIQTATTSPFATGDIFDIANSNGLNFFAFTQNGNFGQGTTTPFSYFAIHEYANNPTIFTTLFSVSSSSASATTTSFMIDNIAHQYSGSSTPPTLTSCGTSPSINGSDTEGTIQFGATATGCTITFAQPWASATAVHCVVSAQTMSLVNALSYTETATALTLTQTSATGKVDYICRGTK